MTRHLTPDEFVSVADGNEAPQMQEHLAACRSCQEEVARLKALLVDLEATPVPEPSPLFWDHFSARVRHATLDLEPPAGGADSSWWWTRGWRPLAMVGALAGAVALAVVLGPGSVSRAPESIVADAAPSAAIIAFEEDGTWDLVVGLASELEWTDVRAAVVPRSGTADALIDELTPEQREALVRLLQAEIGEFE